MNRKSKDRTETLGDAREIVRSKVAAEYPSLFRLYKHLHAHPELSCQEEKTAVRVAEELKRAGCEVTTGIGRYGVVGVLKNGRGPTVLVRADMDALPVKEQTGLPYASTVTTKDDLGNEVPVMHACGHDFHMTSLIGVARVLAQLKNRWGGTLVLIGQPAEENGLDWPTSGRKRLGRAGDAQGRLVHSLSEAGFLPRAARQIGFAGWGAGMHTGAHDG